MMTRAVRDGAKQLRCALVVAVAVFGAAPGSIVRAAGPGLQFEPADISFGVIGRALEQDVTRDVEIRNVSDKPFDLRTAAIGCGCMSAEVLNPGLLQPDESGTVRVTLNHRRVRPGKATYPLTVVDGTENVASVDVSYEYAPIVSADHFDLFIDTEQGAAEGVSTAVRVRGRGAGSPPRVACDHKSFTATLTPSASEKGLYELRVTCADKVPPVGRVDATVLIYLPGSKEPDLKVPILYRMPLPVTARPSTVALKTLRWGDEIRRTVRLTSHRPFSIKSIKSASGSITIVEKGGTGGSAAAVSGEFARLFELTIRPDVTGLFEAEVRVAVDAPVEFEFSIPVVGEVVAND